MGHELLDYDSMVSAGGRVPWHFSLGTPVNLVDGDLTLADAPAVAGMDWLIGGRPLYYPKVIGMNPDGTEAVEWVEVPDRRAVIREDNDLYLGTVGKIHTDIQNQTYFDLAGAIQAEGEGQVFIETAGTLKGNRLVWVLARLDRDLTVDGDQSIPYLLLAGAHDGSMALRVQTTAVRVVCWNTLSWAISAAERWWTARHTSGATTRVEEIKKALGLTWAYLDAWEADVHRMMDTTVHPRQFDQFVERLIPLDPNPTDRMVKAATERREQVRGIYDSPTCLRFRDTAWGAFNAGTEWSQWRRPVQSVTRAERLGERAVTGELSDEATRIRNILIKAVPALAS